MSHETLRTYRTDLVALDRWMLLFKHRTLVTASEADIRDFLEAKYRLDVKYRLDANFRAGSSRNSLSTLPSLSCIKRFYFYLRDGGFRTDDPTENVFVRTPRLVRRDLTLVKTAPAR